jgi:hypothetical protein
MKLRMSVAFVSLVVTAILLTPSVAPAQDTNPPKCCNHGPTAGLSDGDTALSLISARITMSDAALRSMGLSRSQFVDSLLKGILPDRQVTVTFSIARAGDSYWPPDQAVPAEQPAKVILQYSIPRERMQAEQIDALDQLAITAGDVRIEINFVREMGIATLP